MLSLNKKITANKTKHFLNDNDLSYYRGKQYFEGGSGKQNILVLLPINKSFRLNLVASRANYVLSWKSKGYLMKILDHLQHLITNSIQN